MPRGKASYSVNESALKTGARSAGSDITFLHIQSSLQNLILIFDFRGNGLTDRADGIFEPVFGQADQRNDHIF